MHSLAQAHSHQNPLFWWKQDKVTDIEPWLLNQRMPTARHQERQARGKTQIWKMCWMAEKKYLWHCKGVPLGGCAFRRMCISIHATQEGALGSLPRGDRQQQEDRLKSEGRYRKGFSSVPRGPVLGPVLLNVFMIDLGFGGESTPSLLMTQNWQEWQMP